MKKMRVSLHNGRGNSKHNDRSFLKNWTDDEIREKAEHIDLNKMKNNIYWATEKTEKKLSDRATFEEIELAYYNKFFSKALDETNQNYIRQGHSERVKTMDDWYKSEQKKPYESILQVGDMNSNIDHEDFKKMCFDYVNHIIKTYSKNIKILDFAIHFDETSPHMHLRQVFVYQDGKTDGKTTLKIGQNKALEQLGIDLPDPTKKASRRNNRKMTLDKELRKKWQEIAKSYGYDIETEPRVSVRHKDKEEYINDQIAKKQESLKQLDEKIEAAVKNADSREYKRFNKHLKVLGYSLVSNEELETLKNDYTALQKQNKSLTQQNKILQVDSNELKKLKDNPSKLIYEARNQAKNIIEKAEKQANQIINSAKLDLDMLNRLEHYEHLENEFHEEFKQLEADYKNSKHHKHQQKKDESFFDRL